jgi:MarR family 2-MHQ and catechol resistance regulon transcriptional repressor
MGTHYQGKVNEIQALNTYIKLSRAAEAVNHQINKHLKDYDLTTSQFGVLESLYHLGPLQTGQLGEKILKSSGNMTLVIDNLVRRGLVQRQRLEEDRRCIEIHLTSHGQELVTKILPGHVTRVVDAFSVLKPNEKEQLDSLCRKLGLAQEF